MKTRKIELKLLQVRGHQLMASTIKTHDINRGIEILYNLRRNVNTQTVGLVDANGKQYFVGNVVTPEKLKMLRATPTLSTWDHLTLGMLQYKITEDPTKSVVQVNSKDPIFVLINKEDVVFDPLMNQIFPPVRSKHQHSGRE